MTLAMIACGLLYYEQSAATTRPTPSLRGGAADAAIQLSQKPGAADKTLDCRAPSGLAVTKN